MRRVWWKFRSNRTPSPKFFRKSWPKLSEDPTFKFLYFLHIQIQWSKRERLRVAWWKTRIPSANKSFHVKHQYQRLGILELFDHNPGMCVHQDLAGAGCTGFLRLLDPLWTPHQLTGESVCVHICFFCLSAMRFLYRIKNFWSSPEVLTRYRNLGHSNTRWPRTVHVLVIQ